MRDSGPEKEKMIEFFREVADVMRRHPEVADRFVLAERDAKGGETALGGEEEGLVGDGPSDAATHVMRARASFGRQVCVKFGIDPSTGQRVCVKWVDEVA